MSQETEPRRLRVEFTEILAGHRHILPWYGIDVYRPNKCSCGTELDPPAMAGDWEQSMTIHRAHVASVLADRVQAEKAAAWQVGYSKGADDQYDAELGVLTVKAPNPYYYDRGSNPQQHDQPDANPANNAVSSET